MRRDIDFSFTKHPMTGDLSTKKDNSAIRQALKNIVLTSFYERGFNINFGTNVRQSLFELASPLDVKTMKDHIIEGIENFEPMVELIDVMVTRGSDYNTVDVSVIYTSYNNPNEQTVDFQLERIR